MENVAVLCDDLQITVLSFTGLPETRFSAIAWRAWHARRKRFTDEVLRYIDIDRTPFVARLCHKESGVRFLVVSSVRKVSKELGEGGAHWFQLYLRSIVP